MLIQGIFVVTQTSGPHSLFEVSVHELRCQNEHIHVAGTRMIAQGTDGVSRGCLGQGVMAGEAMFAFIPIHQSAMERSEHLLPWIRNWSTSEALLLSELDWFEKATTSKDGKEILGILSNAQFYQQTELTFGHLPLLPPMMRWPS
jgi:hypothetical protein